MHPPSATGKKYNSECIHQIAKLQHITVNDCFHFFRRACCRPKSEVSTSRRPVRVGIRASEKNQVILQPSPTLFKDSTHDHSTPRLQLPSLEFSSCTPCNAQFLFLRYEELDQAAVDLCTDISTFQHDDVPSRPNRNPFAQSDAGIPPASQAVHA